MSGLSSHARQGGVGAPRSLKFDTPPSSPQVFEMSTPSQGASAAAAAASDDSGGGGVRDKDAHAIQVLAKLLRIKDA